MGSELFLRFPREKPSLTRQTKREREKEVWPESSTVARPWSGGSLLEIDSTRVPDTHGMFLGSLS
jgi:hypothetical protein